MEPFPSQLRENIEPPKIVAQKIASNLRYTILCLGAIVAVLFLKPTLLGQDLSLGKNEDPQNPRAAETLRLKETPEEATEN